MSICMWLDMVEWLATTSTTKTKPTSQQNKMSISLFQRKSIQENPLLFSCFKGKMERIQMPICKYLVVVTLHKYTHTKVYIYYYIFSGVCRFLPHVSLDSFAHQKDQLYFFPILSFPSGYSTTQPASLLVFSLSCFSSWLKM